MSTKTIVYASHGDEPLYADAYLCDGPAPVPAIIAVHGGGWKGGTKNAYRHLGPFVAERGYALIAIDYRLVNGAKNRYPAAVDDVRAALRYVREHAAELNVDPRRIVLLGDSAGGHLAALVGLTERPAVQAVAGVYGVYDLAAQWQHDLAIRPTENIAQDFLGEALFANRRLYFDASPVSHAVSANAGPIFLLAWGTNDDIVDATQSEAFLLALKQAGFMARPVIQLAPHYWIGDPIDEAGSHAGFFAVRLLRYLNDRLP